MVKFSSNPLLFKIQYINKEILDTTMGISGVLGQAFHHAMDVYHGGNDSIVLSNESDAIEKGLEEGLKFLDQYNDGFITYSKNIPNKQKALEYLSFCFNEYVQSNTFDISNVLGTEIDISEEIDVEWKDQRLSLPIKLKGRIDKLVEKDDKITIIDYKTCYSFSDPEKIDGAKILQAVVYYLLVYAKYGKAPYSLTFEEVKYSKNADGTPQVRKYEIVYEDNELYFDFFFRFYQDMIRALSGEMVYVPNVNALFENEISIVAYVQRLDVSEEQAKLMKKHKVQTITELLKKELQTASKLKTLANTMEKVFKSGKSLDYSTMKNEDKIRTKMMEHGLLIQFVDKIEGATVDLYRFTPSIGLKMSRIRNFTDDIEQVLGVSDIRILAPIPNSDLIGFEVPRTDRRFPDLPKNKGFDINIGQTIDGKNRVFDIRTAPHMLVAGSSGSGKSVFLHALIKQIQTIPNVEMHLFDPKQVELDQYQNLNKVVEYESNPREITKSLQKIAEEMDERYTVLKDAKVKNIADFNGKLPYKFVIIDEYADLVMKGQTEYFIQLLAQKGRACGIHLIIATQRASTKVISGDTKVNFPVKVVFRMDKETSSRVMIDQGGAEKLKGKGDMLFSSDFGLERLQGYNA